METHRQMKSRRRLAAFVSLISCGMLWGCYRSAPPDILDFRPPLKPVATAPTTSEAVQEESPQAPPPPPPPEPEAQPVQARVAATAPAAPPPTEPKPEPTAPQGPTLVGTWRLVEMVENGAAMPMPEGVGMTFTLTEDGTMSMSVSGAPGGEAPPAVQGTYTISGNQITVSLQNQTHTGTYTFKGNSEVTLDFGTRQMTLRRS